MEENLPQRGWFDAATARQLIVGNEAGYWGTASTLLPLLCIEIWFGGFCDAPRGPT